ncbi:hypothetical protein V8E54_002115, partial [Elaphomyces granulatus]
MQQYGEIITTSITTIELNDNWHTAVITTSLGGISKWTMLRMLGLSMPMPKAMVAGNTISSISSSKSTLGLTIPNAILARNLGSSLALQVVNTSSISAGSGGVGGISGRETCVWVSHHTSSDVDGGRQFLPTYHEITNIHRSEYRISSKSHQHNPWAHYPKRDPGEKSRIIPRTAGCQHRIPERGIRHCCVLPPRPFRNG